MSMTSIPRLGPARSDGVSDRPGWTEVVAGLFVFAIVGFGGGAILVQSGLDPVVLGLILAAWTGIAGLAGFGAAVVIRIRTWRAFGVRSITRRWVVIALGLGVVAFALKGVVVVGFMALTGLTANPQDIYAVGASGGLIAMIAATFFIGVLTPIGEEFLFRGVLTNALLRYGPLVGVVGSALVFALLHGINVVFPGALVAGLVAGEVFRRSGSIWPGVIIHVVFNLPTIPLMVLLNSSA